METETLWPLHIHLFLFMFFADVSAFHFKEIQWNLHITLNSKPHHVEASLSSGMFDLIHGSHSGVSDALRPSSLFSTSKLKHFGTSMVKSSLLRNSSSLSLSLPNPSTPSPVFISLSQQLLSVHTAATLLTVMLCSYSPAWETWPIAKCGGSSAHVQTQTHTGTHMQTHMGTHIGFWVRC